MPLKLESLAAKKDSLLLPKSSIEFQVSAPHITAEMAIRTMRSEERR